MDRGQGWKGLVNLLHCLGENINFGSGYRARHNPMAPAV